MSTFQVSDVALQQRPLATTTLAASLEDLAGATVEASGSNVVGRPEHALTRAKSSFHPFARTVHESFANHYPLALSPDDVWLVIAQGFAQHVSQHHETLRKQFVRHAGKPEITIERHEFVNGSADNDWPGAFTELSNGVAQHIGEKKRDLLVCDFSTTGLIEKAASEIVLLDAMKHYFELTVATLCGIPQLTLLGSVADWKDIEQRAAALSEYEGCKPWLDALGPVLKEFTVAAKGTPRTDFWRSFYKSNDASGGPYITGAINVFFPYLQRYDRTFARNGMMLDWAKPARLGTSPCSLPLGLAKVPFTWDYLGTKLPMDFLGGFVGVAQDQVSLTVRPVIGWGVQDARGEQQSRY